MLRGSVNQLFKKLWIKLKFKPLVDRFFLNLSLTKKYLVGLYVFWFIVGWVAGFLALSVVLFCLATLIFWLILRQKIILLFLAIGFGTGFFQGKFIVQKNAEKAKLAEQTVKDLKQLTGKVILEPKPKPDGVEYYLEVIEPVNLGRIKVKFPKWPEYYYGDILLVKGVYKIPKNLPNSDFDYEQYLERNGIFIDLIVIDIKKIGESKQIGDLVLRKTYDFKKSLISLIDRHLHEPEASLLSGILLGFQASFSEDFINKLRITGTTHIVAISGYNMTIIIEFVDKMGKKLGKFKSIFSLILVIWFGFMTGMGPPVLRAVLSTLMRVLGKFLGRKIDSTAINLWCAAIMLTLFPNLLFSISFQLTFGAVFGLIFWVPILESFLDGIPEWMKDGSINSMSAFMLTFPVSMYQFGGISLISFFANFLALPFVEIVMGEGFLALFIGILLSKVQRMSLLVNFLFWATWVPLNIIKQSISLTANLSIFYLSVGIDQKPLLLTVLLVEAILLLLLTPLKNTYNLKLKLHESHLSGD